MREISRQELLGQLRESVDLLAAPASGQERWLAQHRFPVDELALQLDAAVPGWFSPLAEAGLLPSGAQAALRALNEFFSSFSGPQNAALWTEEALYEAKEWQHARELAQRALAEMDRNTEDEELPCGYRQPTHKLMICSICSEQPVRVFFIRSGIVMISSA